MTIPKFRAWLKDEQRMIESYDTLAIDYENEEIVTQKIYSERGLAIERDIYSYDFDDVNLMQSTGLFDENGKEVFEGDVVHAYGEDTYLIGVIEYFDNAYCIKNKNGIYNPLWINAEQYEIIGNIWEDGECYVCKKEIFEKTYREVVEND